MKWGANIFRQLWLGVLIFPVAVHVASAAQKETAFSISPKTTELLESYCFSCHDEETQKWVQCLAFSPDGHIRCYDVTAP